MQLIDLTHAIQNGMMLYPGDPEIAIQEGLTHQRDYCHVDKLHLNSHVGTHIDAPFHFLPAGKPISAFPAENFLRRGVAIDLRRKQAHEIITAEDLRAAPLEPGCAAVLVTGWYRYFGTEEYYAHPYLSREAAELLVDRGVAIVAVDFLNVDRTFGEDWDAHQVLLGHETLIVENLNNTFALDFGKRYLFSFLPLKISGTDGSPIRAVAWETEPIEDRYCKVEIFLPESHFPALQQALQAVDAGHIGGYDCCLSYSPVMSCWRPLAGTTPYLGTQGEISREPEWKVEVTCKRENVDRTVEAIKAVHPYEEPVINVIPLYRTSF